MTRIKTQVSKAYHKQKRAGRKKNEYKLKRDAVFTQKLTGAQNKSRQPKVLWTYRSFSECNLYPQINPDDPRKPTNEELKAAHVLVESNFQLLDHGRVLVMDKDKNEVIAYVKFTDIKDLSPEEYDNLDFLARFLHHCKRFVHPVGSPSRSWAGKMWAIGWRKAMVTAEMIGRYIKEIKTPTEKLQYDELMSYSERASSILGGLFSQMAHLPFQKNQSLMQKYHIPSFSNLSFDDPLGTSHCSPHLTFTSNGFCNPPHHDDNDISDFAFALFLPQKKACGSLTSSVDGYNVQDGHFVIPDYGVGINFSNQKGIVKLLWASKKYRHCTLPPVENSLYTRLAMSLQINVRTLNTCRSIQDGTIHHTKANKNKILHIADHDYYMNKN